jgi:hypothetical protein
VYLYVNLIKKMFIHLRNKFCKQRRNFPSKDRALHLLTRFKVGNLIIRVKLNIRTPSKHSGGQSWYRVWYIII